MMIENFFKNILLQWLPCLVALQLSCIDDSSPARPDIHFRMSGRLVEITNRGVEIRHQMVHDGKVLDWKRKLGPRRASPEQEEISPSKADPNLDDISIEELAENLRAVALYEGHEFIESEPAWDLAREVKRLHEQKIDDGPKGEPYQGSADEELEFRDVINTDSRVVRNNLSFPYRTQIILDNVGTTAIGKSQGTAGLIGDSTAMSSAHVFWDESANDWEADMSWAPGYDSYDAEPVSLGDSSPWGSWHQCYLVSIPQGYINHENFDYDFAVIDFDVGCNSVKDGVNSDRPGATVGSLGYWVAPVTTIAGTIHIDGYPQGNCPGGVSCNTRLWGHSHSGSSAAANLIQHYVDTSGGQSGASAWLYDGGHYLVGTHSGYLWPSNRARRYTNMVHNFMKDNSSEY